MFKNVTGQKIQLFAFDITTGAPKTGDAANITAYVSKDHGAVTVLGDTSATEMDATNAKGIYVLDLTQGETNADELTFSAKSTTSNISVTPRFISTNPPSFTAFVTPAGATVAAVTGAVGSVAAGGITAASFAANAINAAKLDPDVTTELQASADAALAAVGLTSTITGRIDIAVSSRLSTVTYTAPDNTGIAAIKTKTDFLPSATAGAAGGVFIAGSNAATSITTALTANVIGNVTGNLSGSVGSVTGSVGSVTGAVGSVTGAVGSVTGNVGGNVTGTVASVVGAVGSVTGLTASDVGAIKAVTDKVDTALVLDGAVYQFTANALELGPSGSGLDAAGVRAAVGLASANLDTQLDALPTNAELATALGTADDAVLAAVATLQTTADAIPTNAELATALGTADDAVLAQVALVKAKTDLIPASPTAVGDLPTTAQIADKILGRNLAGGSDTGRLVKDALRSLRNKSAIVAGTLTVYEEDDSTPAWTGVITTAPGDPLTSIDPA